MKNPYKHLRERAGYTQKRFCDEYGFAKQTLISIEQGVYEELSTRMITAILDACLLSGIDATAELSAEYADDTIAATYRQWRVAQRYNCDPRIIEYNPATAVYPESSDNFSPMHWFVKNTTGSVQGFAKQLKVQTAILLGYIRGEQKDMPYPLREALSDAGYPYIKELEKEQTDWNKN